MLRELWYSVCASCRPQRNYTVRNVFHLVVLATLFASLAAVVSHESSFLTLEARPQAVKQGETFFIYIRANVHKPVNAIDISIKYPETQMKVVGIDTGESVITFWAEDPSANNGVIHMRGGTYRKGFVGEHTIARVKAVATESGSAKIVIDAARLIAGDGTGTDVAVTQSDRGITKIYIQNSDGSLVGEASVYIVTDLNGDGLVTISDISIFMSAWFNKGNLFDFNGDGKMTFRDFSILLADSFFR